MLKHFRGERACRFPFCSVLRYLATTQNLVKTEKPIAQSILGSSPLAKVWPGKTTGCHSNAMKTDFAIVGAVSATFINFGFRLLLLLLIHLLILIDTIDSLISTFFGDGSLLYAKKSIIDKIST